MFLIAVLTFKNCDHFNGEGTVGTGFPPMEQEMENFASQIRNSLKYLPSHSRNKIVKCRGKPAFPPINVFLQQLAFPSDFG